jgi:hypothetical protein
VGTSKIQPHAHVSEIATILATSKLSLTKEVSVHYVFFPVESAKKLNRNFRVSNFFTPSLFIFPLIVPEDVIVCFLIKELKVAV